MRLVYATPSLYPLRGGAELSTHTLLTDLSCEHETHAIYWGAENNDIEKDELHIHPRRNTVRVPRFDQLRLWLENKNWLEILGEFTEHSKPDVVMTSLGLAPSSVEVARMYEIPSILFIRSYEHFCPIGFANGVDCNRKCWFCVPKVNSKLYNTLKHVQDILQYPFTRKMLDWHERAVKGANIVIANSQYVADLTKRWFDINAEFIYPFVDVSSAERAPGKDYITLINPSPIKGVKVFIEITEKLKDRAFLCVGRMPPLFEYRKRLLRLPNLRYVEWEPDMNRVYSQTRVLLVPSIWPEPFGRVCVEAMARGIPCIVSRRGGLPEAVGEAGVILDDPLHVDTWVDAILTLDNDKEYRERSERAREQATRFDLKQQCAKFKRILEAMA
jgi:glycosyltransferase involved in cell wall biosynthesis